MAYHAKRQGEDAFSKKVARKDTKCFICAESIPKGSERYVSGYGNSLCDKCYKTWMDRRKNILMNGQWQEALPKR